MQSIVGDKLLFSFIILILVLISGCLQDNEQLNDDESDQVMVTQVIDGDTIKVSFSNGSIATIRFLGIDCPETNIQDNYVNEYNQINNLSCLTYYGLQAKSYVSSLINNSQITIRFDNNTEKKDEFGRYLCYVIYDKIDVNAQLLKQGYARVFTLETFSQKASYLALEQVAMDESKGLWDCQSTSSYLIISQVHYNALGNDEENLNDEYIVIVNTNTEPIDLSGYSIRDEHGNQFDFPAGFFLPEKNSLTIYTGSGTNLSTALYWHHETPVWNNDGDTVFIYDPEKRIIETYSY